ncbi:tRNA ligase 1-like [Gossypium arboreum]|nr:tRNA ligase 1-like [Gossypium arboreum]XP_017623772.1 tRNA ligase 1-like [Gossypium arboreum]
MSQKQRRGSGNREQKWQPKTKPNPVTSASASVDEAVTSKLGGLSISDGQVWKPKSYGTVTGSNAASATDVQTEKNNVDLSRIFLKPHLLENFKVDNSTYSLAQIRATFYPKFENEKSDQEVSLKHSVSLFMYAGNEGGAYAKNSFGNIYTAVGVFVLGRMFHEAWGSKAGEKQVQFNDFIEWNRICISMELVTAVLGDHGQRSREDYGNGI